MPKYDAFSIRMKEYESFESQRKLMAMLPIIARIDGINFSAFTHGLQRPYDERLSKLMVTLSEWLLQYFGAKAAYTQSDEITLGWHFDNYETEMFCGGRVQQLTSHLAARASVKFNKLLPNYIPEKADEEPAFDARIFSMPNLVEAANQFVWREQDSTKNAISMAARAYYSHKEINNKNGPEMQEMLFQKGINFNDYPNFFKRGTFIVKRTVMTPFSKEELESLPEKHEARKNPDLIIERNRYIKCVDLPKFSTVLNRPGFLFLGEEPIIAQQ